LSVTYFLISVVVLALLGCSTGGSWIVPHCRAPAPLLGHYDPRAPNYIVKLKDYQDDFAPTMERLQKKYPLKLLGQPRTSSNMLYGLPTESQVNHLRCDPAVEYIEHDAIATTSNNRLERSRVASSLGQRGKSMIGIKCLRLTLVKPGVAQPHR
jgi:hypothetical protein